MLLVLLSIALISNCQLSKQPESFYRDLFAASMKAQTSVLLPDMTKVDIVTDTFAIEVDFGPKWAEAIGQSLYYSRSLNKRAGVLLIVDRETEERFVRRLMEVAVFEGITVWVMEYPTNKWTKIKYGFYYTYD